MPHVNLLPWREKLRQHQKQQYIMGLVAVAAITGLLFWFIGQAIDQKINHQHARNQFLEQKILLLDAQIAEIQKLKDSKNAIEQRMSLIEQLQASRNVAAIILDELAKLVPSGVTLESLNRVDNQITIEGISNSNNHLSDFIRALESSSVFTAIELSSIKADAQTSRAISNFTLTFALHPLVAPMSSANNTEAKS